MRRLKALPGGQERDWTKRFPEFVPFVRIATNPKRTDAERTAAMRVLVGSKSARGPLFAIITRKRWEEHRRRLKSELELRQASWTKINEDRKHPRPLSDFECEWRLPILIEAKARCRDGGLDALGAHLTNAGIEDLLYGPDYRDRFKNEMRMDNLEHLAEIHLWNTNPSAILNAETASDLLDAVTEATEGLTQQRSAESMYKDRHLNPTRSDRHFEIHSIKADEVVRYLTDLTGLPVHRVALLTAWTDFNGENRDLRSKGREELVRRSGKSAGTVRQQVRRDRQRMKEALTAAIEAGEVKVLTDEIGHLYFELSREVSQNGSRLRLCNRGRKIS